MNNYQYASVPSAPEEVVQRKATRNPDTPLIRGQIQEQVLKDLVAVFVDGFLSVFDNRMPDVGHRLLDSRSGVELVPVQAGHYAGKVLVQLVVGLGCDRLETESGALNNQKQYFLYNLLKLT